MYWLSFGWPIKLLDTHLSPSIDLVALRAMMASLFVDTLNVVLQPFLGIEGL